VNGYLVPVGDQSALTKRMEELATEPETRAAMSGHSRARAMEFSWDACTDKYLQLLTSVHGESRAAA
jgi:glycosyltransferase involved in cell wall biosynthesis